VFKHQHASCNYLKPFRHLVSYLRMKDIRGWYIICWKLSIRFYIISLMVCPLFLLSNIVRIPSTLRPANSPLWVKRQKADALENPNFVYSVLRSHQDFQTLATFTLMSGLRDIQKKKANRAGTSSPPSTSFLSSYLPHYSLPISSSLLLYVTPSREGLATES
jgi:hypothetical protein